MTRRVLALAVYVSIVLVPNAGWARDPQRVVTAGRAPAAPLRATIGNGIAGADIARPAARGSVGGAAARAGGIDGGTVHRRH